METPSIPIATPDKVAEQRRDHTRFRLLAAAVLTVLATMAGVSVWRMRSLNGLPDVGDPFDVAVALRPISIPDRDNAFVSYIAASKMLTTFTTAIDRSLRKTRTWSSADKKIRDYLSQNRPALEKWREASERPDALYHQPGETSVDLSMPMASHLRTFSRLASLESARLEEQGAMDEAWSWCKAMLRASRHLGRHGVLIEREMGAYDHEQAARRILHWAADPRVNAALLRRALDDVRSADSMTPPASESMKLGYVVCLRELEELRETLSQFPLPGGPNGLLEKAASMAGVKNHVQRVRLLISNDIERSRRVLRLLYSNWLAQVDKTADERSPVAVHKPNVIFAADPSAPLAARAIDPETLKAAIEQSLLAGCFVRPRAGSEMSQDAWSESYWQPTGLLAREPRRRALLIVKLAAELYRRERAKTPEHTGALLGTYLEKLPEGITSDEPIPEGID
jgi:hypothetical protein